MSSQSEPIKPIPDCYKCKWRGEVPGSCHSSCNHPELGSYHLKVLWLVQSNNPIGVTGSEHGRKRGWFNFPLDFDPVWLESCNGFQEGGEPNMDEHEQTASNDNHQSCKSSNQSFSKSKQ